MPSRNVIKEFASENYYHVYNRGVAKQPIFLSTVDKKYFLKILKRHLDPEDKSTKSDGVTYRKFDADIELLCYCLMGNHFHMYFYLAGESTRISEFMQAILTAYTMYFNKKYKRVGTLFQGVFKGARTSSDSYLMHITRYIHMNPRYYKTYEFSSLPLYLGKEKLSWVKPERILEMFEGEDYMKFLEDYEDQKIMFEILKYELADT